MTSSLPRRFLGQGPAFGLAAVTMSALCFAVPAAAQTADDSDCTPSGDVLRGSDEAAAVALAAACDTAVLIETSQDYTVRSFAQPDGSVTSEFSMVPQWVPDESGEWVEASPVIETAADGSLGAVATVADLEFASAGERAFATATNADGEQLSLTWPEPLPEPEVDGSIVTYPEVLPGVDLEVYAGVADFSYALVVKSSEAAASAALESVELGFDSEGLTVESDADSDTAVLTNDAGEVAFSVAEPWMWDSSLNDAEVPELAAPMSLEIDADSLTVVPDQEVLSDPEAVYPIYIDPQITFEDASYENVFSEGTGISCGSGDMCTGFQGWSSDATYGSWRSALKFNGLSVLEGRDIQHATVWVTQTHTGGAGATQTVRLYAMDWFDFTAATSWNTYNGALLGEVATDSVATSNDDAGEANRQITWADGRTATRLQSVADAGGNTAVFGVLSGASSTQEANRNYWRKLDPGSAKLTVWHGPKRPTNMLTNGAQCSSSAPGPTINTLTPTFTVTAPNPLESTNILKFYVYAKAGVPDNHLQKIEVVNVAAGSAKTVTVPPGVLERGKTYRWNSRIQDSDTDSTRTSDFTGYCYFTVNSLPNIPTGLSTDGLGCGTQTAPTLVTTATPDLWATPSDPDGGSVTAKYQVYDQAGTLKMDPPVITQSGIAVYPPINDGVLTDALYKWRVSTLDVFASSTASAYCWMNIDTDAPEPPEVVQVNEDALPGDVVDFKFIGGSDVKSFEYSFNSGAVNTVSAPNGVAEIPYDTAPTDPIDHTLQVWALDAAGNPSSPKVYRFILIAPQPADAIGAWRFDGDHLDDAGEADLTPVGTAITGADRASRGNAAAVFDGTGGSCLSAGAPVVDSTNSYTVAGWVYAPAAPASEVAVMDVTGAQTSHLKLLLTSTGRWGVAMTLADGSTQTVAVFADAVATDFGAWTHLAAVYDVPSQSLRIYVNGSLEATKPATHSWEAEGVFSIGCGVKADSSTFGHFTGSVDDAVVFQQALTSGQIEDLMTGEGMPAVLQAWYPLRGDGLDASGRATDLTGMPSTPAWQDDQYGRPASSLELGGATCPTAAAPVRTDSAFSLSAWVRLDTHHVNDHPRVFSFDGDQTFSIMAKYNANTDKWNVGVTAEDIAVPSWGDGAVSTQVASEEAWTQITVTVDSDNNSLQLFVNGQLADTGTISATWNPWRASELVIGCAGTAGIDSSKWEGAISDVRVWRGVLDSDQVSAVYDQAHPERASHWELDEDPSVLGFDQWGENDLTFTGEYSWETNRWDSCWAAYGLDLEGGGYAATDDAVLRTDESFSLSTWVKIDDNDRGHTVFSQITEQGTSFELAYVSELDKWQFSMRNSAADGGTRIAVSSDENIVLGDWYHLTVTFDLATGLMHLYVNGAAQGEPAQGPLHPWHGDGQLLVGASGNTAGERWSYMAGSIDQVYAWTGVLDAYTIAIYAHEEPPPVVDEDNPACEGTDPPDIED